MVEAVAASKSERPNVIESKNKSCLFMFDEKHYLEHLFSAKDWLEDVVLSFGSNVKGRMASFRKLTNSKMKSAVLLSEVSMEIYFPIRGLQSKDNIWLLYNQIMAYHASDSQTTNVHFANGFIYKVPVNYRVIASQMKRCNLYKKQIENNKLHSLQKNSYIKNYLLTFPN